MTLYLSRYLHPVASGPIEDGALLVREGRIVAAGKRHDVEPLAAGAEIVDFGEAVLLPPLVNAHTHLELTHFPLWAAGAGLVEEPPSFVDWILRVIKVKRSLEPKSFAPSLTEGIRLSLASGTGAVGDILSFFPAREAYHRSPLKGRLYLETLGRDPARNRDMLRSIGRLIEERRAGNLEIGISPHSPYNLSGEYLEEVFDFARRNKVPASLHLAESAEETEFLWSSSGSFVDRLFPRVGWQGLVPPPARRRPAHFVAERGGLVPWNLLAHGVQCDEKEAARLAEAGCTLALCPRSNARLGVGDAPVGLLRKAGVKLALGTDSLASNDSLSVWDEMTFALDRFEGALPPAELLKMATTGGAEALGLGSEMGSLREGVGANFQVLRPKALPRLSELEDFLCSAGRTRDVETLYLDGQEVGRT